MVCKSTMEISVGDAKHLGYALCGIIRHYMEIECYLRGEDERDMCVVVDVTGLDVDAVSDEIIELAYTFLDVTIDDLGGIF